VFFPIEVRFVKGDDIWLSPFYQRDTCSIAVHRYFEEDFQPYFRTIEPILRKYQGSIPWRGRIFASCIPAGTISRKCAGHSIPRGGS
jgi:hypothetical protein